MVNEVAWSDGLPFPRDEYTSRVRRVQQEMIQRGIDVLYVTSPANLKYLTNYDSIWYEGRNPTGVVVTHDGNEPFFFDSEYHARKVLETTTAMARRSLFYPEDPKREFSEATAVLETFRSLGWTDGTIGLELSSWAPSAVLLRFLEDKLTSMGAQLVDGSFVVDGVSLFKSPLEIACVRRAAAIADRAIEAVADFLRPGVTEISVAAHIEAVMADAGGEKPAIPTVVKSGPNAVRNHIPPSRRPLDRGDVVAIDTSGSFNRYHVNIARTFSLGQNDVVRAILDQTKDSVVAVLEAIRVGTPLMDAQRVADEFIDRAGLRQQVQFVGGYALGVSLPPNWVGHVWLSESWGGDEVRFEPGLVMNYENLLHAGKSQWPANYIETILMSEQGPEILSNLPRSLHVIE